MSVDTLGTNCDQCRSMVQCCFTSTETVRLIRTESPGRPPRLSHSSWTLMSMERREEVVIWVVWGGGGWVRGWVWGVSCQQSMSALNVAHFRRKRTFRKCCRPESAFIQRWLLYTPLLLPLLLKTFCVTTSSCCLCSSEFSVWNLPGYNDSLHCWLTTRVR